MARRSGRVTAVNLSHELPEESRDPRDRNRLRFLPPPRAGQSGSPDHADRLVAQAHRAHRGPIRAPLRLTTSARSPVDRHKTAQNAHSQKADSRCPGQECRVRWKIRGKTRHVAAAIETVRASASAAPAIKLAFELLAATAAGSSEVRQATWNEINIASRVWTISAMRMKASREHRVPLRRRALEIIEAARTLGADSSGLVFSACAGPVQRNGTLDEMSLGSLRDTMSAALFPGTSYIQTRLRYVLFVPWIYQRLADKRVSSADVEQAARNAEVDLIRPLERSEDTDGIIGVVACDALVRLPSTLHRSALTRCGASSASAEAGLVPLALRVVRGPSHHHRLSPGSPVALRRLPLACDTSSSSSTLPDAIKKIRVRGYTTPTTADAARWIAAGSPDLAVDLRGMPGCILWRAPARQLAPAPRQLATTVSASRRT